MYKGYSFWRMWIIICCLGLTIFWIMSYQATRVVTPVAATGGEEVLLEVIPGASSAAVARELERAGLVRSQFFFRLYSRYHGYDQYLQAGEYRFSTDMTVGEIAEKLRKGEIEVRYEVLTLPEGLNIDQVAARLEAQGLVDASTFLEKARDPRWDYWFLEEVPLESFSLEGFLFPDTYHLPLGAGEEDIINILLQQFDFVFNPAYRERAQELDLGVHQVVTLASIIEREARLEPEKPIVSSVFHNRLKTGMLLQSCATVQYALGENKPNLTNQDLRTESPYNTYLHPGLPPGPIVSPGKASLEAALYPEETGYFYFVLKGDNSGAHHFGQTLQEHQDNRRKAREERDTP